MNPQVLVVDDQVSFCHHLRTVLEGEGYDVAVAHDANEAMTKFSSQPVEVLLVDMKLPGMDGLQLFKKAKKLDPDVTGIIMTAYGTISSAVTSIKDGVSDYIQKPFEPEALCIALERSLRERRILQEIRDLRREVDQRYSFSNIIGKSLKMQYVYELIQKVAPTDTRVLITGETGVGKELVAKAIHFNSLRKNKPFVGINCGALTETLLETELFGHEKGAFTGAIRTKKGKFEYAQGGTLFLDEVGDVSPGMQVKLLRVLQERVFERVGGNQPIPVDVRIISATNQDLREKVKEKEFRIELFYRLNVVPIRIPPLRERVGDIPLLVKHFIEIFNKSLKMDIKHISPRVMAQLMEYHWPGNVRELENVLERAFVTADGDTIDHVMFSHEIHERGPAGSPHTVDLDIPFNVARSMVIRGFEKAYLFEALERSGGNVSEAANRTGVNVRTLWRKIKTYGLTTERHTGEAQSSI